MAELEWIDADVERVPVDVEALLNDGRGPADGPARWGKTTDAGEEFALSYTSEYACVLGGKRVGA